jgi:hypothetical protein
LDFHAIGTLKFVRRRHAFSPEEMENEAFSMEQPLFSKFKGVSLHSKIERRHIGQCGTDRWGHI